MWDPRVDARPRVEMNGKEDLHTQRRAHFDAAYRAACSRRHRRRALPLRCVSSSLRRWRQPPQAIWKRAGRPERAGVRRLHARAPNRGYAVASPAEPPWATIRARHNRNIWTAETCRAARAQPSRPPESTASPTGVARVAPPRTSPPCHEREVLLTEYRPEAVERTRGCE